ncbi:hypothetical protein F5H01DRAFT_66861 [Linnemannia elongata]|nr:hypothetical protein F5H01DRAFT_66861 [Linnemannia elongata]
MQRGGVVTVLLLLTLTTDTGQRWIEASVGSNCRSSQVWGRKKRGGGCHSPTKGRQTRGRTQIANGIFLSLPCLPVSFPTKRTNTDRQTPTNPP